MFTSSPAPRVRKGTVLVVEDELRSQRLLRINLEPLGYQVLTTGQAEGVSEIVETHNPDLVVLDIRLPDGDGFEVCQRIREQSSVPIIILSAFGHAADKARGLELGADDYITKPFDPAEFSARIEAILRRAQGRPLTQPSIFKCGELTIDFEQRLVVLSGTEISLSRTEYRLLEYLALNAGRTLVADALLSHVWGPEYRGDYASLHLYVSRLRHKLHEDSHAPRFILTKPGIGYVMPHPSTFEPGGNDRKR
jgi:DNA-binding response OmpR family regulator